MSTIQFTVEISEEEKKIAKILKKLLKKVDDKLSVFNDYLNKMYDPFKKYKEVSETSILDYRGLIWDYAEGIKSRLLAVRTIATEAMKFLERFQSDVNVSQMISSLDSEFEILKKYTDVYVEILLKWDNNNYQNDVVSATEKLKESINDTKKLVGDRVIDYLDANIITDRWLDREENEDYEPLVSKLFKERKDKK